MFVKTFLGDYMWEINTKIYLRYVDDSFKDLFDGIPRTSIAIDDTYYELRGDFRKELEATEGDLEKIKQVFIDNFKHINYEIPNKDYAPAMSVFINHINEHIK